MKLNIYKNQKEIAKTYIVDEYDIMYGTVQDILAILDDLDSVDLKNIKGDEQKLLNVITKNRSKLDALLLDIFSEKGLTEEELKMIKLKELIPLFLDLFNYVRTSFARKN